MSEPTNPKRTADEWQALIEAYLASGLTQKAFCERQGIIQGYGILSIAAGEAHLLNLCVRPETQRQGVGEKMLVHLVSLARRHYAEIIFLEVRQSNAAARRLYDKAGFNELGNRKDYYPAEDGREDALILARVL